MKEKSTLFPFKPWSITEREFSVKNNHYSEAIFSLGNGYMGMRGTLEEDYTGPDNSTTPGMYLNGVYASEEIIYGEEAPGLPEKSQTIINIAEWSKINIYLDMEKLDLLKGEVRNYRRKLDMKKGVLEREFIWKSSTGKEMQFWITRFLSQSSPHTGLIIYRFKPLNFSGSIRLATRLDGNTQNYHFPREKRLLSIEEITFQEDIEYLVQRANSTGILIGMAVANSFNTEKMIREESRKIFSGKLISQYDLEVREGEEYCLSRHLAVYTSLDLENNNELLTDNLKELVIYELMTGLEKGSQVLLSEHLEYMKEYWEDMDIKIAGDPALQQAFRFNALQLLQSVGRDGKT
ncbi:MAG: glycoside hydrolase family 65 protein, partial [Halanaerobiaceae bacterium]|nr:glycoside hydrolase family 65 protein [Halanaerobiaceae bacterium]